jgi:hypothetical protein
MIKLQAAVAAVALLCGGSAVTQAQASQVLTIPYSSAQATINSGDSCLNNYPYHWQSGTNGCALMFPLNIPVGHVIHQISVVRSTNDAPAPIPYFQAALEVTDLTAVTSQERFLWVPNNYAPSGTTENHRLMRQTKVGYLDEFSVAPDTSYQVFVLMYPGAYTFAVQVVYD